MREHEPQGPASSRKGPLIDGHSGTVDGDTGTGRQGRKGRTVKVTHGGYVKSDEPIEKVAGDRKLFIDLDPGDALFDFIVEWVADRLPEDRRKDLRHVEIEVKYMPVAVTAEIDPVEGLVKSGGGYRPYQARVVGLY